MNSASWDHSAPKIVQVTGPATSGTSAKVARPIPGVPALIKELLWRRPVSNGMTLKSFGCSFIWGSELPDEDPISHHSNLTWPALMAQNLALEYQCHAWPGRGNLFIAEKILKHTQPGDRIVVNWTYIDRFDYTDPADDTNWWYSIRPTDCGEAGRTYYRMFHSQYRDKLTSLMMIDQCVQYLRSSDIPFYMTYQDVLLFETEWHCSPAILVLQQRIKPHLRDFAGKNFVQWAQAQGHPVTAQGHLLETGHRAVADHLIQAGVLQ